MVVPIYRRNANPLRDVKLSPVTGQREGVITGSRTDEEHKSNTGRERAILCARVAADNRGRDIVVLDMTELVKWVDYLVVGTASSRRQMAAISDAIEAALKPLGETKLGSEGYEQGNWIALDFGDILVHLFNDDKRAYYEIEHLWGDAPRVAWQRESDRVADERSAESPAPAPPSGKSESAPEPPRP